MEALLDAWSDEADRLSRARASRLEFERQFRQDLAEFERQIGQSWRRADST
jgi:hypothetical protein